jgi:thymidylate synthase
MYGFYALQKYVAKQAGIGIGKIFYQPTLPHLYCDRDYSELKKWL